MRRFFLVAAAMVASALVAVFVVGAAGSAVVPQPGDILSGHDLGFRVEKVGNDGVIGTFVVRINGEWTDAEQPSLPREMPAKP